MTAWAVVLAAALCTYLLRASALVTSSGGRLPRWIIRRVELVAPAALGALITASALHNDRAAAVGLASVAAFVRGTPLPESLHRARRRLPDAVVRADPAPLRSDPHLRERSSCSVMTCSGPGARPRDLGGAFLVGEQAGPLDDVQSGVRERANHRSGAVERKERILLAPDELDRYLDRSVNGGELAHVTHVEASQESDRGIEVWSRGVQRLEEELIELSVEQGGVGERATEHESIAPKVPTLDDPGEAGAGTRYVPRRKEELESPTQPSRLFGIDQPQRSHAAVSGHGVPGDQPATVVSDEGDVVQTQLVDDPSDGDDLLVDGDRGGVGEAAGPCARQIDHVACELVGQVRKQLPKGRTADRPAVDEQHVGSGAETSMRHLTSAHVQEAIGGSSEPFGGLTLR